MAIRNAMTLAEWKRLQKRPSKYRNEPVVVDGQRFDSKAEAKHYTRICCHLGQIKLVLRQVPFRLPGGVVYRADFLIVWKHGEIEVQEVKGCWTEAAKIKWKQVKELYPNVRFTEVKA